MKVENTPEWKAMIARHRREVDQLGPNPGRGQVNSLNAKHEDAEVALRKRLHNKLQREGRVHYEVHRDGTHEYYCGELLVQLDPKSGHVSAFVFAPYGDEYLELSGSTITAVMRGDMEGPPMLGKMVQRAHAKYKELNASTPSPSRPRHSSAGRLITPVERRVNCPFCKAPRGSRCVVASTTRITDVPHHARERAASKASVSANMRRAR